MAQEALHVDTLYVEVVAELDEDSVLVDAVLTATHFSFLTSSFSSEASSVFSLSSSDVTLSSVSASIPVLASDSEVAVEVASVEVEESVVASAGAVSVDEGEVVEEESLFAASARAFFFAARSLRSCFCRDTGDEKTRKSKKACFRVSPPWFPFLPSEQSQINMKISLIVVYLTIRGSHLFGLLLFLL